jgi:hypothetical protein
LVHLVADAVELVLHRLDPAGAQAELFEERGDFTFGAAHLFERGVGVGAVRMGEDSLEKLLVVFEEAVHRLGIFGQPLLDNALG